MSEPTKTTEPKSSFCVIVGKAHRWVNGGEQGGDRPVICGDCGADLEDEEDEPTELLRCPFCGDSLIQVERVGTSRQSCVVSCEQCGCRLESNENGFCKAWNTRPPAEPVSEAPIGVADIHRILNGEKAAMEKVGIERVTKMLLQNEEEMKQLADVMVSWFPEINGAHADPAGRAIFLLRELRKLREQKAPCLDSAAVERPLTNPIARDNIE